MYMDVRANPNALQWVNGYTSWYSPPKGKLYSVVKRNELLIHIHRSNRETLCSGKEAGLRRLPAARFPSCDILIKATLHRQETRCVVARGVGEPQAIEGMVEFGAEGAVLCLDCGGGCCCCC